MPKNAFKFYFDFSKSDFFVICRLVVGKIFTILFHPRQFKKKLFYTLKCRKTHSTFILNSVNVIFCKRLVEGKIVTILFYP